MVILLTERMIVHGVVCDSNETISFMISTKGERPTVTGEIDIMAIFCYFPFSVQSNGVLAHTGKHGMDKR